MSEALACVSMGCDHPRRRYACGHADCEMAFDGDRCIPCGVSSRGQWRTTTHNPSTSEAWGEIEMIFSEHRGVSRPIPRYRAA